ncbi:hypothetical protein ACWCQW_37120 [Streptomyces mirabilis]
MRAADDIIRAVVDAIDCLINTVDSLRLTLRQDAYDRLMSAAARLNYPDSVTDIHPRLLVPAPDAV